MASLGATIDVLSLLGDPTRVRLLRLLAGRELSVADLVAITQLAQPRVSTHLARLREAGVVRSLRVGGSTVYALNDGRMPGEAKRVWAAVSEGIRDKVLDSDRRRCEALLRAREAGAGFPHALAGQMERVYSPGRTWESLTRGLVGLLRLGDVVDLGCGDGAVAEIVAPRARHVACVDRSPRMLEAARRRLARFPHVEVKAGDLHALPFEAARFDQALLYGALLYAEQPARVLAEAARVLRPGGTLALVALAEHDHAEIASAFGHVHPGFRQSALAGWLESAGLDVRECAVTSRERREPHFEVLTAFADKPARARSRAAPPSHRGPKRPTTEIEGTT